MRNTSLITIAILISPLAACDNPKPPPVDSSTPAQNSAPATAPASALSGEKKDLKLGVVPLVLRVPVEWKLNEAGGVMAIEGPLPGASDAEIIISRLTPMNADRTQRWFAAATQPANQEYLTNDVREINGLKVWETATVEHGAAPDPQSGATTAPSWISLRFTILVPEGGQTLPCSLGFSGMSRADYTSQKDLIESIIGTVRQVEDTMQ